LIAYAQKLRELGISDRQALHVTAVDIDSIGVRPAYCQVTLYHIPAIGIYGYALIGVAVTTDCGRLTGHLYNDRFQSEAVTRALAPTACSSAAAVIRTRLQILAIDR
jgi:hypothetical protein